MTALNGRCIYFFDFWVVIWLIVARTANGQSCSCTVPRGCDLPQLCAEAGSCNKENVARGRPLYYSSELLPDSTCRPVDGITLPPDNDAECPFWESKLSDYYAWWKVDLSQNYTITSITVYRRTNWPTRMADIHVMVDDQVCYRFPTHQDLSASGWLDLVLQVKCDPPLTGRYITLQKVNTNKTDDYQTHIISVCEVQVWGCASGYYGADCGPCGQCMGGTCSPVTGECTAGCEAGWKPPLCQECADGRYGSQCAELCGNCKNNSTCNNVTGECPEGCQAGYHGPFCKQTCGNGTYGQNCSNECGQCIEGSTCNTETGECPSGCQSGWQGAYCNQTCAIGKYGANCTFTCANCRDNACNGTTGVCENGCNDDFSGPYCNEECMQCSGGSTSIPTTQAPSLTAEASAGEGGPDLSVIVGPAVGGLVLLVIALVVIVFVLRRKRKTNKTTSPKDDTKESEDTPRVEEVDLQNSPLSFAPVVVKVPTGQKTVKPSVAVQPTPFTPPKTNTSDSGHVYMNQPQQTPASNEHPAGSPPVAARTTEHHEMESDAASVDAFHVYQNEDDVYASFKATRPELDNVQRYLVDRLASGELRATFQRLAPGADLPRNVSNLDVNYKKNRFASIQPYDCNRIILRDGYSHERATDFVNASYISGYTSEKAYIAAQGPRDNTVADFWRMVWQEKTTHIVMLTNVKENGKNKCFEYWPGKKKSENYGPVKVTGLGEDHRASFIVRTFKLKLSGTREERGVAQYHYISWPDHDAPTTTSLIMFWRFVMARTARSTVPLLVHCSAGVGRTGSFIGLDLGFQMAVKEGEVDVAGLVTRMRDERCWMVQAPEQFLFLHKALLEAYTARDTFKSVGEFASSFPQPVSILNPDTGIDKEFKTLLQMRTLAAAEQTHVFAEEDANITKNRNPDALPPDGHLVYLTENIPGGNQYINAVYFSTFWQERGTILTQLPLPNTLIDFWRMVYGDGVKTIVSLASKDEEAQVTPYCWYWPRSQGETITKGPYMIRHQVTSQIGDNITSYTVQLEKEGTTGPRDVRVLRYEDWTGEVPANTAHLLHLVEALDNTRTHGKEPPVIVQCSDGVAKSGLFCVVCDIIHRMRCDREVDVYMAVRHLQNVRPQAVQSQVQYRYLYDVAQRQAAEMTVYANT